MKRDWQLPWTVDLLMSPYFSEAGQRELEAQRGSSVVVEGQPAGLPLAWQGCLYSLWLRWVLRR